MIDLAADTTALVLIDLQNGILDLPVAPRPASEVLAAGLQLAARFRSAGAPVVLVNVAFSADGGDALAQLVDRPMPRPLGGLPEGWSELAGGLARPGDIRVTKHQWGGFYGTDLDVQLRRRRIRTVALGGIATNQGVESTARQAHEHGYDVVVVEDACAGFSSAMHAFAVETIFPMLGRVTASKDLALRPRT